MIPRKHTSILMGGEEDSANLGNLPDDPLPMSPSLFLLGPFLIGYQSTCPLP